MPALLLSAPNLKLTTFNKADIARPFRVRWIQAVPTIAGKKPKAYLKGDKIIVSVLWKDYLSKLPRSGQIRGRHAAGVIEEWQRLRTK